MPTAQNNEYFKVTYFGVVCPKLLQSYFEVAYSVALHKLPFKGSNKRTQYIEYNKSQLPVVIFRAFTKSIIKIYTNKLLG